MKLHKNGPDAPKHDPHTGLVTEDYYVAGHMGAQKGAVYAQWMQCWQLYSMMGAKPLDVWVMTAPPPGNDALASPSCITENAKHAWELSPPWMKAPTPAAVMNPGSVWQNVYANIAQQEHQ